MRIQDRTISRYFRNWLLERYPSLTTNNSYLRFTIYLMFTSYRCSETDKYIASRQVLAQIEEKDGQVYHRNYNGKEFLDAYSRDVQSITYEDWNYIQGLARVVDVTWPADVEAMLCYERQRVWKDTGKVYAVSGEAYTPKTRTEERNSARTYALEGTSHNIYSQRVAEYLNDLKPHIFTKLLRNLDMAYLEAVRIVDSRKRKQQIDTLRAVEDQPQPFCRPGGNTTRVFTINESLLGLKKRIRRVLCRGWYEADLANAQLAIIAKIWHIPELHNYLSRGNEVWPLFCEYFEIDDVDKLKSAIKQPLYSICYGMSRSKVKKKAEANLKELGIDNGGTKFLRHFIVGKLLKAKSAMIAEIKHRRGAYDAFGEFIELDKITSENPVLTLLAQIAQSYELRILWPAYQLAIDNKEVTITVSLHDGFMVDFTRRPERWIKEMMKLVNAEAENLDIPTRLKFEELK